MSEPEEKRELSPIRDRALGYLARREHTWLELSRKLIHAGYPENDIESVLEEFAQRGWLSNKRFAETYVQQKQGRFGSLKLEHELRSRGVDDSTVKQLMESSKESELARATEIWMRKFGARAHNGKDRARQMRFLQSRGFSADVVVRVVSGIKRD